MNPYQMFKTDDKAEAEVGVTLDYGAFRIRVVRAGGANKKFGKVLANKMKPFRRQIDTETMDNDVANRLLAEAYAETVIVGWETKTEDGKFVPTLPDAEGKPLAFNRDNVVKVMLDLPELFRDVQEQANKVSLFRVEEREADAKNS